MESNKPRIKKRHWALGSTIIVVGSWITHTTTATVYDDFNNQQAMSFANAVPNNGTALIGGLPDEYFIKPMQLMHGPISSRTESGLSPSNHIFSEPVEEYNEQSYTVKRGDTLGSIFKKLNLDLGLPHRISQHNIGKQLTSLSIGRTLVFKSSKEENKLRKVSYPIGALKKLVVSIEPETELTAEIVDLPFETREVAISGEIQSSLYEAATEAGLSISLVMDMVRIFGWDIDFVLDIRAGDSFHVVYEEHHENGNALTDGNILAAEFTTRGETYNAIRFETNSGESSYFNPEGKSMLGTFLRSPVEFSRISSRFGKRKHPILKTWRAHKGVDYAAGRGTPIRATADGKVIHAGKKGGYGKTVILRHAGRFTTLYGHMNGYAKNVRSGSRVQQGDVIGYIGSTGLATGPHLHYEFRLDGVHRNPLTFKSPKASSVAEIDIAEFQLLTSQRLAKLKSVGEQYLLAKNQARASTQALEAF
jgi:murein DD-endopeptidase MepM/ murein hydrolase activator NlpD